MLGLKVFNKMSKRGHVVTKRKKKIFYRKLKENADSYYNINEERYCTWK
jgi:hypothetical protein